MLIDTHSHIYDTQFDSDREETIKRAYEAGIKKILMPAIDKNSDQALFIVSKLHPGICFPMMGLHPTSVNNNPEYKLELQKVADYLKNPPEGTQFYGIGETGLDLYWEQAYLNEQTEALCFQIELALEYELPIIIHTRNAWNEIKEIIDRYKGSNLKGIIHGFSGTLEDYIYIKQRGNFCFGIGGPLTYKKSTLPEIIKQMDINDIVLETDDPYLPPVPYRGKRNEPSYMIKVCEKIAELKNISQKQVEDYTTANALRLFSKIDNSK